MKIWERGKGNLSFSHFIHDEVKMRIWGFLCLSVVGEDMGVTQYWLVSLLYKFQPCAVSRCMGCDSRNDLSAFPD